MRCNYLIGALTRALSLKKEEKTLNLDLFKYGVIVTGKSSKGNLFGAPFVIDLHHMLVNACYRAAIAMDRQSLAKITGTLVAEYLHEDKDNTHTLRPFFVTEPIALVINNVASRLRVEGTLGDIKILKTDEFYSNFLCGEAFWYGDVAKIRNNYMGGLNQLSWAKILPNLCAGIYLDATRMIGKEKATLAITALSIFLTSAFRARRGSCQKCFLLCYHS